MKAMKAGDLRAKTPDELTELLRRWQGAVQPALPARERPARKHGAGASGAARHRAIKTILARSNAAAKVRRRKMPKRVLTGHRRQRQDGQDRDVLVERRVMHPLYKKFITRSKKYAAHDEEQSCKPATRCDRGMPADLKRKTWS
jgi:small subunit ribosomal protein S17